MGKISKNWNLHCKVIIQIDDLKQASSLYASYTITVTGATYLGKVNG